MHQKELAEASDENKKNEGREIGTGHVASLQRHKGLSFYIVDVWTATGIWVAPDQQTIIKSLGTNWNDNKNNLNTWMGDQVTNTR